jgi:hypothetical protein
MSKTERLVIPAGEPPAELIEHCLEQEFIENLALFADNVETARRVFRDYPKFVTAKKFPKRLRKAFISYYEYAPEGSIGLSDECMKPGHRETLRDMAYSMAKAWMDNGAAVEVLCELGLEEESAKLRKLRADHEAALPVEQPPDPEVMAKLDLMMGVSMVRMMESCYGKERLRKLSDEMELKIEEEALLKGKSTHQSTRDEAIKVGAAWAEGKRSGTIEGKPATKAVQ